MILELSKKEVSLMTTCLHSKSLKTLQKQGYQSMDQKAVGLPSMNITGNTVDGKQYSTKETTTVVHLIDMTRVNTTTLCLL